MKRSAVRAVLATLVASVALTGCDFDVYKLPLPGGADVGEDPIAIKVMFNDVLDLVPKSTVKVNDVSVGQISDIDLDGYTAVVSLEVRRDVKLPDNALAQIRQTSLLGEKFVSLSAPDTDASTNPLSDGDVIPLSRSGRNPEVEEVLGALSLVLNGGGVAQLRTIAQELNLALTGREGSVRSVLDQIDQFTGTLDQNKADIVTAIESLNRLSLSAQEQLPVIDRTLEKLPSALNSIDAQRADLVKMLQALDNLSDVGVRVIQQSKDSTIASLKALQPVLTQFANSGDDFVNAFNTFYAYPFVDEVVGRDPQVARNLHNGDYTNLSVTLDIDLNDLPDLPGLPTDLPVPVIPAVLGTVNGVTACLNALAAAGPSAAIPPSCSSLPANSLNQIRTICTSPDPSNAELVAACNTLTSVPNLIPVLVPGLGATSGKQGNKTGGGAGNGTKKVPNPVTPIVPQAPVSSLLNGLTGGGNKSGGGGGLLGLNRAGTGWAPPSADGQGGPTIAQLQSVYDPDLVSLLIPGMVKQ